MTVHVVRRSTKTMSQEDDDLLLHLHNAGRTVTEMSWIMGFPENKLRAKLSAKGLVPNITRKPRPTGKLLPEPPPPAFKADPLRVAEETWGMAFNRETMRLNGQPVKLAGLMKATNQRRKELGLRQCLNNPEWEA